MSDQDGTTPRHHEPRRGMNAGVATVLAVAIGAAVWVALMDDDEPEQPTPTATLTAEPTRQPGDAP